MEIFLPIQPFSTRDYSEFFYVDFEYPSWSSEDSCSIYKLGTISKEISEWNTVRVTLNQGSFIVRKAPFN